MPYFIALFTYIAFFYFAQLVPSARIFFKPEQIIADFTVRDWFINVFILPFNGTLWFIRDLFVIYLLSPILLYISQNKILNIASHILLGLCWLFVVNCHIEALLFVFLGLDIVKLSPKIKNVTIDVNTKKYIAVSFFLLVITKLIYMSFFKNEKYDIINIFLLKCTILTGLPFLFLIIRTMVETDRQKFLKNILVDYNKYSFFTYLFHMLILTVIRNVLELIPVKIGNLGIIAQKLYEIDQNIVKVHRVRLFKTPVV